MDSQPVSDALLSLIGQFDESEIFFTQVESHSGGK